MKKLSFGLLLNCLSLFVFAQAQKGRVMVTVSNEQSHPLENATTELLKSKDSALVKTSLSDKDGLAEFENISYGNYIIRISSTGFAT